MKPVLIYISKENCPACLAFSREWTQIKRMIGDNRATFVTFHVTPSKAIPPVLTRPDYWFPTLILADPESYYHCFTPNDQPRPDNWTDDYKIKGHRYASVEQDGKLIWSGKMANANSIVDWFNRMITA